MYTLAMPSLRSIAHVLLALALMVNGALPGMAAPASGADHTAGHGAPADQPAGCHGQAAEAGTPSPAPAPMDCCDGGACACNCLHHAPVVFLAEAQLSAPTHHWVAALGRFVSSPSAPTAPAIRPPIA